MADYHSAFIQIQVVRCTTEGKMRASSDGQWLIIARLIIRGSIQIRWYLPDLSETLDGKKWYPTKGVAVSESSGGSPLTVTKVQSESLLFKIK